MSVALFSVQKITFIMSSTFFFINVRAPLFCENVSTVLKTKIIVELLFCFVFFFVLFSFLQTLLWEWLKDSFSSWLNESVEDDGRPISPSLCPGDQSSEREQSAHRRAWKGSLRAAFSMTKRDLLWKPGCIQFGDKQTGD